MSTTTLNGKPRKQLADQLDRLDTIIDALAEGLPGAVADACREGARAAVKDVLLEVLTNPELRALIAPQPAPVPAAPTVPPEPVPTTKPGLWSRLRGKAAAARSAIVGTVTTARESVAGRCKAAHDGLVAVGRAAGEALPVKDISLVALCAAVVVGAACLVVPQAVAAAVGAIGAAATAVAVQTGFWLKRAARRFGLVG